MSIVVTGANRHDSVPLEQLLKEGFAAPAAQQPSDTEEASAELSDATQAPCNLCLDAAYVGKEPVAKKYNFIPHIRPRGEEKKLIERNPDFKARRWVVEAAHSWFNRFRKLIPRYEKTDLSYLNLTRLAATLIILNKIMLIYG